MDLEMPRVGALLVPLENQDSEAWGAPFARQSHGNHRRVPWTPHIQASTRRLEGERLRNLLGSQTKQDSGEKHVGHEEPGDAGTEPEGGSILCKALLPPTHATSGAPEEHKLGACQAHQHPQ